MFKCWSRPAKHVGCRVVFSFRLTVRMAEEERMPGGGGRVTRSQARRSAGAGAGAGADGVSLNSSLNSETNLTTAGSREAEVHDSLAGEQLQMEISPEFSGRFGYSCDLKLPSRDPTPSTQARVRS